MRESPTAEVLIARAVESAARRNVPAIIASLRAAASVEPSWSMTAVRMAEIGLQTSGAAAARCWLRRAAAIDPGNGAVPVVLAGILRLEAAAALRRGDANAATVLLRRRLALAPDGDDAYFDLAGIAASADIARALLLRSLAVRAWAGALVNLANVDKGAFRLEAAIGRYRAALMLDPGHAIAWNNLATTLRDSADVAGALKGYRRALAAEPSAATESNLLQCLQFDQELDDDEIAAAHRRWALRYAVGLEDRHAFANGKDESRPLVVGYVSADLGRHPVGFFLLPVMEGHDRAAVRSVCYSTRDLGDEVTAALKAKADVWIDVAALDDQVLADRIRRDRIDILVDLSGHTAHNRLLVFARRPAPVQATWLGYFDTTGLPQIDYLLTDAWEAPADRRSRISEEVIALPAGRFAYRPPAYAPEVRLRAPKLPPTFGSFNNLGKLTDNTVRVWSRILAARPDARLLLKWSSLADPGVARAVERRFAGHGIAPDRLLLRGATGHDAMLAEYGDVDIALDPAPFSGCLTTVEALWMGVPVVTLEGGRPVARQSTAILRRIGLDALVAGTEDAYVDIAVALAADGERRADLRKTMRQRMTASTLLDGRAVAASLEAAYRGMWQRWCAAP